MAYDILIVDDEADIRTVIADVLKDEGYDSRCAADGPSALEAIQARRPSLIILDIWLGDSRFDGMKVLEKLQNDHPEVPVIMMSGHGNIETAVTAIKRGAYDFVEKPFKADRLLLVIQRAIETSRLRQENRTLKTMINPNVALIGKSTYAQQMRDLIAKVAPTNSRIFISGASGSGKEIIARQIHAQSPRGKNGPFTVLNCATLNPERAEEELFGREASIKKDIPAKVGLLEQTHLGTLLLDEVTDMPLAIQGKITRLLQDNTFQRIDGEMKVEVDLRIIATSSRDVSQAIKENKFREDLYYRLSVVPIRAHPLSERKEDIPSLAEHFLTLASKMNGHPKRCLSDDALAALQAYNWPGNIRQLHNVIDWLLIMATGDENQPITAEMLPPEVMSDLPVTPQWEGGHEILKLPLRDAREVFERQYLLSQVSRFSGNISQTANFVGMERSALHRKLRILGVGRSDGR